VNDQSDKLAMVVSRIKLTTHAWKSMCHGIKAETLAKLRVWGKVPNRCTLISEDSQIPLQHSAA